MLTGRQQEIWKFLTEYVDEIHLKGRTRPVRLYRVSGINDPKSSAPLKSGAPP